MLVRWNNIELFAVSPASCGLMYTTTLASWCDLESPRWFILTKTFCCYNCIGLLASNRMWLTNRVRRLTVLEILVLMIGAFFGIVSNGLVRTYAVGRMLYKSDHIGVHGLLGSRCSTLVLSVELFLLMAECDFNPELGVLALLRAIEINFSVEDQPGYFLSSYNDSIVYNLRALV